MTTGTTFANHWAKNALNTFLSLLLLLPSFAAFAQPSPHPGRSAKPCASSTQSGKSFDQLKVGDVIRARSNATGKVEWKQVTHASKRTVPVLLSVQFADAHSNRLAETFTCTLDQPVRLSSGKAISAGKLSVGNSIVTRAGPARKIKALFFLRKPGGFVLCDVRVGPLSVAQAKMLYLSQRGQVQDKPYSSARLADSHLPAFYASSTSMGSGTVNPYQFNGEQFDPASSTYYLRARYYDPETGRFLSLDPHEGNPYEPITLQKYIYAVDDPINYVDPTGREPDLASLGAAGVATSTIVAEEEPAIVTSLEKAGEVAGEVADAASGTAQNFIQRATDVLVKRWNPFTGPGPIGNLPNGQQIINTFRGGSYSEVTTTEVTTLYRVFANGGNASGSYWTRIPPSGPLQSQLDLALLPEWGNTAENVATIEVPAGTTFYEGFAAAQQGSVTLPGGGSQVFIPNVDPGWLVK